MLFYFLCELLNLGLALAAQTPLIYGKPKERIAIIGAGAGGTSAAYYLQRYSDHGFDITIYESSDRIGGRTTTVDIHGNSSLKFEVGASIFVSANKILKKAADEFELTIDKYRSALESDGKLETVGLYDGSSIILELDSSWKSYFKLLWRYGRAPLTTLNITKKFVSTFLEFYYDSHFPFPSLDVITHVSGFLYATNVTGEEYFKEAGVSESYYKEMVQAFTRVNYAQNLDQLHAVGTMVSLAANGAMQIKGGNWQIFQHFAESANATIKLSEKVQELKSIDGKWTVLSGNRTSEVFDQVIIASPWTQANIAGLEKIPFPDVVYVKLHVTIFTSTQKLSAKYFGGDSDYEVPGTILTTVSLSKVHLKYFSISIHEFLPDTKEYVFKIFSKNVVSDEDLLELLDEDAQITWIHRKVWNSYPYLVPTSQFADFDAAPGLWYLNSMESFISTMETSALAGANVAALICQGRNTTDLVVP